jgi:hypothetical protein
MTESAFSHNGRVAGRISTTLTAESDSAGGLTLFLQPPGDAEGFRLRRVALMVAMWRESGAVVRVSVTNPKTHTVAYFQGAEPALDLVRELGLELIPCKEIDR